MARKDEYDWLDDPFDEKKAARDAGGMSGGTKAALGIGCLVAVVGIVALLLFAGINAIGILADL